MKIELESVGFAIKGPVLQPVRRCVIIDNRPGIIIWTVSIMIDVIDGLGPHLSLLCPPSLSIAAAGGQSAPTSAASPTQFWNLEPKISWPPTLHSQPNPKFVQSIRSQEEFKISRSSLQNLTAEDLPRTAPRATGLKVS